MWDSHESIGVLHPVFEEFAEKREDTYSSSLAYYLLTGRKGLRLYSDGSHRVPVCQHPNLDDTTLIFPEVGGISSLTVKTLHLLLQQNQKIQLSRYTADDYEALQSALENHPIHLTEREETVLDWRFPVRILDTQKVTKSDKKSGKRI